MGMGNVVTHNIITAKPELPSKITREAKCDYFGICGGCSMQNISQQGQVSFKEKITLQELEQYQILPKKTLNPIYTNEWHYRHRARLSVKYDKKKSSVYIGFRELKNSKYIAKISSCHILKEKVSNHIPRLKELISHLSIKSSIPQLEVISADNQTAYVFRILKELDDKDLQLLTDFSHNEKVAIYLQPGNYSTITPLNSSIQDILYYTIPEHSLTLYFKPNQFTQINFNANKLMIAKVIELLDCQQDDIIYDLFCGIGNFSLPISKFVKTVIGFELVPEMIQQAELNANKNNIKNTLFYTQDLFENATFDPNLPRPKKVIIDPPRTGAKEIIKNLIEIQPNCIIYISCNYITFSSDAEILIQSGYTMEKLGIIDMFSQTKHFELLGVFTINE